MGDIPIDDSDSGEIITHISGCDLQAVDTAIRAARVALGGADILKHPHRDTGGQIKWTAREIEMAVLGRRRFRHSAPPNPDHQSSG